MRGRMSVHPGRRSERRQQGQERTLARAVADEAILRQQSQEAKLLTENSVGEYEATNQT